jgi:hypothetical protein
MRTVDVQQRGKKGTIVAIRPRQGRIAIKVKVSLGVRWEDRPAQEDLMLFAWARATRA